MPEGSSHHFSDQESGNLGQDNLNSLDIGGNVYAVGVGSLNVNVTAVRYVTTGGTLDFAGSLGVAIPPSSLGVAVFLTTPGNLLTVDPAGFPVGEHLPLAEADTSGVEVVAIRDKRHAQASAVSGTPPGDVSGPGTAVTLELALFSGTTGKLIAGGSGVTSSGAGVLNGRAISADGTKLDTVATGAEVNPALVSQVEAEAGVATTPRLWSAERVNQAVLVAAPGGVVTTHFLFLGDLSADLGFRRVRNSATNGTFNFSFFIPADFGSLVGIALVMIPRAGTDGPGKDIDLNSEYGQIGEPRTQHSETDTTSLYDFTGQLDELSEIDISSVFSAISAGDVCGIESDHNAIGGTLAYVGVRLSYTKA